MNSLNQILLRPTDVLFFRDGRPMGGSLAGHSAAWPFPDVTNHALHAALHRAELSGVHKHVPGRSSQQRDRTEENRQGNGRVFGSLLTAGPFPVNSSGRWFFPRPKDAQTMGSVTTTVKPVCSLGRDGNDDPRANSSLPVPLKYAVANTLGPDKDAGGEPWISAQAFKAYLRDEPFTPPKPAAHFLGDDQLADHEHQIGIGIDPETQAQDGVRFYSAHYLRLREGFRLGLFAEAMDKVDNSDNKRDLVKALLNGHPEQIVVGGQQRNCSASREDMNGALPLPKGLSAKQDFHRLPNGRYAVKWVLLTPSIWPEIGDRSKDGRPMTPHPGGWLPNWVSIDWDLKERRARDTKRNGEVLLRYRSGEIRRDYSGPRAKRVAEKETAVSAVLVAAIVPKPVTVTGWALPNGAHRPDGGAKSTLLAVPAGAVYYFETGTAEEASTLAAALNWYGVSNGSQIRNRRSTLLGEKGYGLGVCGTWKPFEDVAGHPAK